jgi:hypothetical protein
MTSPSKPSTSSFRLAPFDGLLAAEREDVGATGTSTVINGLGLESNIQSKRMIFP